MSVKFVSAILGPEMAAPILWTPGKMHLFCRKNHVHKIPRFRGGGGSADFIFMGARIFLKIRRPAMEPFFGNRLSRFRGFFPCNFGVPRDIRFNLT